MSTAYDQFDELIRQLRAEGFIEPATKLHRLLHEVAWTSSSELIGELGLALLAFERATPAMGSALRLLVDRCLHSVRKVWPDIEIAE